MVIGQTDFIAGAVQSISKFTLNVLLDLSLATTCPGKEDGTGGCLRSLDALRVIVGHFGRKPCCVTDSINIII